MKQICDDFRAEVNYLHYVFHMFPQEIWAQETKFKNWTSWDVVAHLHLFDLAGMESADGQEAFEEERDRLAMSFQQGKSHQEIARENFAGLSASELLYAWRATGALMADKFSSLDPSIRLPWFGPNMGAHVLDSAIHGDLVSYASHLRPFGARPHAYG